MVKAFLSHSSVDKGVVREIKNKLQRFWTYFDEDCFEPGEDFRTAITNRLSDTNLFVWFVSKSSLTSSWVKFEMDEAYWQSVKRNDINILVLALEDITPQDLPAWMRRAKFGKVRTVSLAAQQIKSMLFSSVSVRNTVYMGRENDTATFYNEIIQYEDIIPNIFAIVGLTGVGRRTFIKDIFARRFSLPYYSEFEIDESEGLVEVYRKLLDENLEERNAEEIEKCYKAFLGASAETQAAEVARALSIYTDAQICPMLIDCGEMLNDDGFYKKQFIEVLRIFKEKYPDCYLAVIHMRLPKLSAQDRDLLHIFRLRALDPTNCYTLFDSLLKRQNIPVSDSNQVKEIAEYLEGYPPAILNAVKQCALEGVDLVCCDKRNLVDFQERVFKKYLESIQLTDLDEDVLSVIYNMNNIAIEPISTILEHPKEFVAASLGHSHDYNIVELRSDGTYSISPPMRVSVERKLHRFSKEKFSEIAKQLIKHYWKPDEAIQFGMIDNIIYAILRSGQEEELKKFKDYLLPSHLLKAAQKANQDRDWPLAENYARKALMIDENLNPAKSILFKVLVRQETTRNIRNVAEEEDQILESLRKARDKGVFYLEGFRLLKRRRYEQAIQKFRLAIQSGDTSIPTYRDLAECYYQTNQIEEARKEIDTIIKDRKIENPFIIDLAAKISIGIEDYDEADSLLEKQELVDRPENVAHRRATYYLKKEDYTTALSYANIACQGDRVLPEMHLLRMGIAIHTGDYNLVNSEYELIGNKYSHYNRDVREILYTTMLLQTQGWAAAEASFMRIRGQSPYAKNIRYKIICAKLKDDKVPFYEKTELEAEKGKLEAEKMFDPFCQLQCFDFQ